MGRIKKVTGPKHHATISPAIADFVTKASSLPVSRIPSHLDSFPSRWPLPRGDLYHWIPLLNRFDAILEQTIKQYGLDEGPQVQPFGTKVLEQGVAEEGKADSVIGTNPDELERLGLSDEGDLQLARSILKFSKVLLENCGNRSLYASSERLGELLNTTNLTLLTDVLQLMVRLAQRFHASRQRTSNASQSFNNALLSSHYNIDLDKVQTLAEPFTKAIPSPSKSTQATPSKKSREKAATRPSTDVSNANDMLELLGPSESASNGSSGGDAEDMSFDHSAWREWAGVSVSYFKPSSTTKEEVKQSTPSVNRRSSTLSRQSRPSSSDESEPLASISGDKPEGKAEAPSRVEITAAQITSTSLEDLAREVTTDIPKDVKFDVLTRLRIASAIAHSANTRRQILGIRLLALTNLAYIYTEDTFKQKILQRDSDEPRHLQLVHQLCDLLSPPSDRSVIVALELQTLALGTLEALAKHRAKAPEVCAALSVNVNHGVLFHLLRSAIAEMKTETTGDVDIKREEWREAGFALLETLPTSAQRTGEALISAGLLGVLVQVLNLRTSRAERSFPKLVTFLNNLVAPARDAFETLAAANGLEAISDLLAWEVASALDRANAGEGLPQEYRNRLTDYQIPFYSQQTLRMIFKMTREMMQINSGNFSRLLRNFMESPSLLGGLRTVITNPSIFGSSVWSGAVNIMSSFIHSEPTSYAVISEAGLSKGFLETLSTKAIDTSSESTEGSETDDLPTATDAERLMPYFSAKMEAVESYVEESLAKGILPAADSIVAIPHAIGALCLNHAGMDMLKKSNALDKFFDIFESPAHVKIMSTEQELAQVLGGSFDELVRHHPTLKTWVLSSLLKMIVRIKNLCLAKGQKANSGAKLWTNNENGQPVPIGTQDFTAENGDVDMTDVNGEAASVRKVVSSDVPLSKSADDTEDSDAPSVLSYINVAMKFLCGFAENPQNCELLVAAGATDKVLELATLPVLRYDCNNHVAMLELRRLLHFFCSEKTTHLVIPAVVQHTQAALDKLAPLISYEGHDSFFGKFSTPNATPENTPNGTLIVESLVCVHTLCMILTEIFLPPSYGSRTPTTPFYSVNLSDVYVKLVKGLGFLHRACVWEEILLIKRLSDSWVKATSVKGYGMGSSQADIVFGLTEHDEEMPDIGPHPNYSNGTSSQNAELLSPSKASKKPVNASDETSAAFRNARTLRFLLSQVPSSTIPFLQNLGKALLGKRRSHGADTYMRQNASIVADAISKSYMDMFSFEPPSKSDKTGQYSYWIVVLTSVARIMIDGSSDRLQGQVLTLLLQSFRKDGGFDVIKGVLETFHKDVQEISNSTGDTVSKEHASRLFTAYQGIQVILNFYNPLMTSKSITESAQTTALQNSEPRNGHAFNASLFLVELRMAVLPVVRTLWESSFVEKASSDIIKSVVDILKTILEASDEHGVRGQNQEQSKPPHKKYEISREKTQILADKGFGGEMSREGLYRCFNDIRSATAYCSRLKHVPGSVGFPIPEYDNERVEMASKSTGTESLEQLPDVTPGTSRDIDRDTSEAAAGLALLSQGDRLQMPLPADPQVAVQETAHDATSMSENLPLSDEAASPDGEASNQMEMSLDNLQSMLPEVQGHGNDPALRQLLEPSSIVFGGEARSNSRGTPQPSRALEALNDARSDIRKELVDRALDVLNVHNDVTFELADLIAAATSKVPDVKSVRAEIVTTLMQSFISFELGDDYEEAGKKIAAYANLLALVLQNKEFFDACSNELKDNFEYMIGFVRLPSNQSAGTTTTPWIGQTLLVIEKILAEDAQPVQVKWTPPGPDGSFPANGSLDIEPPLVSGEAKSDLFEALLKLMPSTGKDEAIVLSIVRILVILTRERDIASRLAEKKNIQRFFLMIKQLSGMTDDKLISAVLVVVRHMFETDEIIRNVIRSEIRNGFESRPNRPSDVQSHARQMNHLAIRSPQIFIEVSNEVLEISHYDSTQKPQALKMKQDPTRQSSPDSHKQGPALEQDMTKASNEDQEVVDKPSAEDDQSSPQKTKPVDKAPSVEHPSGVIHYLLSELLSYKDTDDSVPAQPKLLEANPAANGDSSSASNESASSAGASQSEPGQAVPSSPRPTGLADIKKAEVKPEQHPIHAYRCFILQCLSELLSSYNQAKVEFINFSRKADAKASTPSKPRSGVLNYLLTEAIPVGTVLTEESVSYKKKELTSNWAMAVIVALCLRTKELGHDLKPGTVPDEEQTDLTFVRKFVLEHALKAYKDALNSEEDLHVKYGRLLDLADLFYRLLSGQLLIKGMYPPSGIEIGPQKAVAKLMFERNFIAALTSSIADINLNFKGAERAIKYILRPLKYLTTTAVELSESSSISTTPGLTEEDEISSATSADSDVDERREETPDLFRNSTLGMFEPNREDGSTSEESRSEDDEMYDDEEYDDGMDFDEGMEDPEDVISDEDEELSEVGPIEGVNGDRHVDIIVDEEIDDDPDDDDDLEGEDDEDDDMDEMGEINGDHDNASLDEDNEDEWQDEDDEPLEGSDQLEASQDLDTEDAIRDVVQDMGGPEAALQRLEGLDGGHADLIMDIEEGRYMEDVVRPDEEDDDEEDEDDEDEMQDEDMSYEDFIHDAGGMRERLPDPPWGWDDPDEDSLIRLGRRTHSHHHHHRHHLGRHMAPDPWTIFDGSTASRTPHLYRSHRATSGPRSTDDGVNPLLQRADRGSRQGSLRQSAFNDGPGPSDPLALGDLLSGRLGGIRADSPATFVHQILHLVNQGSPDIRAIPGPNGLHIRFSGNPADLNPGSLDRGFRAMFSEPRLPHPPHTHRSDNRSSLLSFVPQGTSQRWIDEAKMLFGTNDVQNRGQRVVNALLRLMVPPAIEKKKLQEEEGRKLREQAEKRREQEKKAKEEEERKEREEREKREQEAAAAAQAEAEAEAQASAARQQQEAENQPLPDTASEGAMEGVEHTEAESGERIDTEGPTSVDAPGNEMEASHNTERQYVTFNGTQLDITNMGIDQTYLDALPDDIRNEVLMSQLAMQRAQTQAAGEPPTEIDNEFLEALPADIRAELLQQEAQERRRREREEASRQSAGSRGPARAEDMDPASFFASLDPTFRQTVLMEQDEDMLAHLPADIAAEARALAGDRGLHRLGGGSRLARPPNFGGRDHRENQAVKKQPRKQIVQMLDKAGVATLLRLMFLQQQSNVKTPLYGILHDVAQNRQNQSEILSLLISLLQEGCADANAVERSYSQLSVRAKQSGPPKTPLKRTITDSSVADSSTISDMKATPLMVIQQCLASLVFLTSHNIHVPSFFLGENEIASTGKGKASKKGKGKENKASKYPINALLSLLDRPLVVDNMTSVEQLADLLQRITYPLTMLLRKEKESTKSEIKADDSQQSNQVTSDQAPSTVPNEQGITTQDDSAVETPVSAGAEATAAPQMSDIAQQPTQDVAKDLGETQPTSEEASSSKPKDTPKKGRTLTPPFIPDENLASVVNIIVARECPSNTFRATLSTMTNLSAIPGAKHVFGKKLISSALELGQLVLNDLNELIPQIKAASGGNELQAMALTKFSPQSSDQGKLLRVLKALDYLFDPKRDEAKTKPEDVKDDANASSSSKADLVTTLYEDSTFGLLWDKLSECLRAIHQATGMLNVATILLPLVEALMVVCTNTTIKEAPLTRTAKEFAVSSPAPESHMESLFFRFTEEHRKILNELVGQNPKLMSGTFQLLVKNPKVLEFDNKRNYFTRRLHQRNSETRHPQPPLGLNVRREEVFMDSFKSLFFKSGDEIKYGKLNIRFHGEEGVDAGGVTREWFQVMSRQMFNPDYALFIPVASDRTTFHPNKLSKVNDEHLMFFKFIGRIIGKALYEGRALDCHFSRAVYKRILGKTVSIKDMETLDLDYYKSLLWMLENDITEIITETMSVETDDFGVTEIVDLVPNGRNIPVSEENKHEYVQLVIEHRLVGSVEKQLEMFLGGFHDIVPPELISIFNEQELELLISGLPDIDVDDWKGHTDYQNYQPHSPQIQWFWRAVRSFDKEERAKLLQFVTGTSKVPLNGFGQLEGMNGFSRFNVHRDYGNKDRLPSSHTCFNQLDLPEYEDYESLRKQLYTAMTAGSEYFGFA